ncbi:MAG: cytochrome c [Reyranella sp.]|nr:cytochrome c [Reyranella sp.]
MHRSLAAVVMAASLSVSYGVAAQSTVERGKYLVESIMGCGNCHTPQGPNGPLPGKTLAGGLEFEHPGFFKAYSTNITPDPETGIGKWTDAQIKVAIREGRRPDGTLIRPPMPFELYRGLADADLDAVVAYLRTVPAVKNVTPKSTYEIPLPPTYGLPIDKPIEAPSKSDKLAYGAYLTGPLGHCIECHTPPAANGRAQYDTLLGAGGRQFHGPFGLSVAKNITPDPDQGLGKWSDAEIERAIRKGIDRQGQPLKPPMGFAYYDKISAGDMAALIAYLRNLPPKKTP